MITKYYLLFSEATIHDAAGQIIHSLPLNYVIKDKFSFFDGWLIYDRYVENILFNAPKIKSNKKVLVRDRKRRIPPAAQQHSLSCLGGGTPILAGGGGGGCERRGVTLRTQAVMNNYHEIQGYLLHTRLVGMCLTQHKYYVSFPMVIKMKAKMCITAEFWPCNPKEVSNL